MALRVFLALAFLTMTAAAEAQVEFTSPSKAAHGFVLLRYTATESVYRYYDVEAGAIRIMNGPYSTTVATTIPLEANEELALSTGVLLAAYVDMSGDGLNDIVLFKIDATNPALGLYAFRVVNSVTGQTLFRCENAAYSCLFVQAADLDNDGRVELVAKQTPRAAAPVLLPNTPSQYVVMSTNGLAR